MNPTTVTLADGTTYQIPSGGYGSFPWARQASLVSVAYRQVGDEANAAKWAVEFNRRNAIYNALQAGQDRLAVIAQFGADLLAAPVRIAQDVGEGALGVARFVPLIVLGVLLVLAIGFNKGSLKVAL